MERPHSTQKSLVRTLAVSPMKSMGEIGAQASGEVAARPRSLMFIAVGRAEAHIGAGSAEEHKGNTGHRRPWDGAHLEKPGTPAL